MILNGKVESRGVLMPKYPEIYYPILEELKEFGVEFKEEIKQIAELWFMIADWMRFRLEPVLYSFINHKS